MYFAILYNILNLLGVSLVYIVYTLILSLIPLFGLYITLSKEDNIVEVISNILLYIFKPKTYLHTYKNNQNKYMMYKSKRGLVVKRNNKWYNLKSIFK